jgi:hypothetical protein
VDADGRFIADDKCESLGNLHHVFNNPQDVHIDANCYLLGREIAVGCSPIWYAPGYVPNVRDPDRTCCRELLEFFQPASSNRKHTVNYRVGNQARSVQARFFLFGNAKMKRVYPNGLPWETPSP